MRKVSKRAPPEFVAVAIALAQQNRRRGIAIRDPLNVHGQLESLRFKRVKDNFENLHGKPNQRPGSFTIQNQRLSPKTFGNFRLETAKTLPGKATAAGASRLCMNSLKRSRAAPSGMPNSSQRRM